MLKHHGRYQYSPIIERPIFEWPNKTRLACYIGLNLEHFAFGEGVFDIADHITSWGSIG